MENSCASASRCNGYTRRSAARCPPEALRQMQCRARARARFRPRLSARCRSRSSGRSRQRRPASCTHSFSALFLCRSATDGRAVRQTLPKFQHGDLSIAAFVTLDLRHVTLGRQGFSPDLSTAADMLESETVADSAADDHPGATDHVTGCAAAPRAATANELTTRTSPTAPTNARACGAWLDIRPCPTITLIRSSLATLGSSLVPQ